MDRDHRRVSGDPYAYGETDIETVATIVVDGRSVRAGLLVEMKVDARQTEDQGVRYRARARYRTQIGSWEEFKCVLAAPKRYLESTYPLGDSFDAGWDKLVSLEEITQVLKRTPDGADDALIIHQATLPLNSWNKPIPEASQFWSDLARFQLLVYPDVPISINRQQGAGVFVWPSFFENQLAKNPREIRRKRIQIVHSGKTHVALYVKNVRFADFEPVARALLTEGIHLGAPGTAWQSVNIVVPYVNPQLPLEGQADSLDKVFDAARRLYRFFLTHEQQLLSIRTFK